MPAMKYRYSGPMTRNQLMSINQYIASPGFPTLGRWDLARLQNSYVVKGSVARTQPVELTLVCDLSSDIHSLEPHGNYNSGYMGTAELVGKKAKLQFTGQRPATDPDFGADFDVTMTRILGIQGAVATTDYRNYFVIGPEQLKFNFNLFEPKPKESGNNVTSVTSAANTEAASDESNIANYDEEGSSDTTKSEDLDHDGTDGVRPFECTSSVAPSPARMKPSLPYKVAPEFQDAWNGAQQTFNNRIMPVYGVDRKLVPYTMFPKVLKPGTTIIVSFTLSHFPIRGDTRSGRQASDTFTANVVKVVILDLHEPGAPKNLTTPSKKSRFVSQESPSRATLKLAADTFSPIVTKTAALSQQADKNDKGKQRELDTSYQGQSSTTTAVDGSPFSPISGPPGVFHSLNAASLIGAIAAGNHPPLTDLVVDERLLQQLIPVINAFYTNVRPNTALTATAVQSSESVGGTGGNGKTASGAEPGTKQMAADSQNSGAVASSPAGADSLAAPDAETDASRLDASSDNLDTSTRLPIVEDPESALAAASSPVLPAKTDKKRERRNK